MSLKLWMGPSGSGKTRFLFEYVLNEARKHRELNYIVIVPEQFTLSTQRELIKLSDEHGILNVDVLSFQRLAYRVFEEVGFKDAKGKGVDDMDKNLILRHLSLKYEDKLSVLSGKMNKLGYITEVKSVISEFMQYGIDTKKVSEMESDARKNGRGELASKLSDIRVLYELFNSYTDEKYITKEEILVKAARAAYKSQKLKRSVIVFDGFTGFTPVQYDLIETLLTISRDIHVTILTDTRDNITYNTEHELFYLGYKTSEKLKKLAELNNVSIEKDFRIIEEIPRRFLMDNRQNETGKCTSDMLVHLERNLFRQYSRPYKTQNNDTGVSEKPTKVVNGGIALFSAFQPIDEVRKVAVEIQKLVRNNTGIRYKDIAIATGDLDNYIPLFKRVFAEYEIPYFFDKSQRILMNPFIEFVRALTDIIVENYSYSAVFRYLRSPIAGYETDDIDVLENFVLKYGIKGFSAWNRDWVEKYSRYVKKEEIEGLITIDMLRQKVIENLKNLNDLITCAHGKVKKIPTKAVNEINAVFIGVFETHHVKEMLSKAIDSLLITDEIAAADRKKEYEKIYDLVLDLMNRMDNLLAADEITFSEYKELLDAGFDEIRIGMIPLITDYIQIGDVTRSRFENVHTLFIVGANDGIIPQSGNGGGIISDIEKEYLLDSIPGLELSPTVREKAYTVQLYLYMLMTKPKYQLRISYSRMNNSSESIRPSYIIKVITDMFKDISVEMDFESDFDRIYSIESGYRVLVENIRNSEYENLLLLYSDGNIKEFERKARLRNIVDAACLNGVLLGNDAVSKAVAEVLYGKAIIGSVTRLEQFARCSFKYFLQYGLSLKERDIFSFEARDMGNIFHSVLEKYSKYLADEHISWESVSDDKRSEYVRRAISECISDEEYSVLSSSFRHQYLTERIYRISMRSIDVLTTQLSLGKFIPKASEISFSSMDHLDSFVFKLSDDEIMKLSGKIDRFDTYDDEVNGRLYIKVIDYKSGDKSFNLVEVYKGLNLQLVAYLNAAVELSKRDSRYTNYDIIPAGILYYHIDDPMVEGDESESDEQIAQKILKRLKMTGLVNSDREVFSLIDSKMESKSDIMPVAVNKDGALSAYSSVASTEEFEIISQFVNKKIEDLGREILSGNIKAEPHGAKGIDASSCTYCPYTDICKYIGAKTTDDPDSDGDGSETDKEEVTKENVLELMKGELSDGEN